MRTIQEPARELAVVGEYDVVVAGGGPAGIPAAVAAARAGAKTLLIERYGFLGGMATAGLIGPILGVRAGRSEEPIIGGIAEELCRRMESIGGARPFDEFVKKGSIPFEPEALKLVADEITLEAGVELRLHSWVADAVVDDGVLQALVLESKSGRQAVAGKVFVDATGDADIVARADARFTKGRRCDGAMMAMGSIFHIGGVDEANLPTADEMQAIMQMSGQAVDDGIIKTYNRGLGGKGSTLREGQRSINATRFGGDCTDVEDLTRGEIEVRRDTWDLIGFWRERVPAMGGVYLVQTPTNLGLRESRQMVGVERMVGDDIRQARRRDDAVARAAYWIDIHCPLGRVKRDTHLCYKSCPNDPPCQAYEEHYEELPGEDGKPNGPEGRASLHPKDGLWADVPYGALVSEDLINLLAAGRCISMDHQAMGAVRVMGTCMAIGQAAGEAAAMAVEADGHTRAVDVAELQRRLRANGAPC